MQVMIKVFDIEERVWIYNGPAAWYFITIDKKTSKKIKHIPILKRGWGSIPVNVTIGNSEWKTSIFPDKEDVYLLPIKKNIRTKENIKVDSIVKVRIEIIDDLM